MTQRLAWAALIATLTLMSCKRTAGELDLAWSNDLELQSFEPEVLVPGVRPEVVGSGFVTETLGATQLRFQGAHSGPYGNTAVDVVVTASVVSAERIELSNTSFDTLCASGEGRFSGSATLEVTSRQTERLYESESLTLNLTCRETLEPTLASIDAVAAVYLNAPVPLTASDLLVGESEGSATAELSGCFTRESSSSCEPVGPIEVPLTGLDTLRRTGGAFTVPPSLVGLEPGTFEGTVVLVNAHASGEVRRSAELPWEVEVLPSRLDAIEVDGASLGGIVEFEGAGLIGAVDGSGTEVLLSGVFSPDDGTSQRAIDLILVPSFHQHDRLHYVLDEQDALGDIIDFRRESGVVIGSFTPRFYLDGETRSGATIDGTFRVDPLRQVVWLNLTPSYADGLVAFGIREAADALDDGILDVINDVYVGINVDIRRSRPTDYVQYSQVDVTAVDPNGFGLLGYDNTPGKDDGNERLYDHLGGLNALTQQDGYPGYGGVFLESIWAFSLSPPTSITSFSGATQRFDDIFDPVRADIGTPVSAEEATALRPLTSGASCSGDLDREQQVACAVWSLSHIIGSTIAHELAHSFGLADPGGSGFHNPSDGPSRLMDSGDARPFEERAHLGGDAEHLCDGNYAYLRGIMPSADTDPRPSRSACD